jgi:hypothetical protein
MTDTANTLNDSITAAVLREIGVSLRDDEYDARMHRAYVCMDHPEVNTTTARTSWTGKLNKDDYLPYYCPSGWRRFAVKVCPDLRPDGATMDFFWKNSSNMYHGLKPEIVQNITRGGFIPSLCQHGAKAVYLTPSIRYAAHPRYARVQLHKGLYYQVILQCRVLNNKLTKFKDAVFSPSVTKNEWDTTETMGVAQKEAIDGKKEVIDNNHDNDLMEFLWKSDAVVKAKDGLVVTGVLVRCLGQNPIDSAYNTWWLHWQGRDMLVNNYMKQC